MLRYLLRVVVMPIAVILLLDAAVLTGRAIMLTGHAYISLFDPAIERPLLGALEAIDLFFLALVFFIMAIGVVQLFIAEMPMFQDESFRWLKIDSFMALKLMLWDTFLVTLFVLFITRVALAPTLDWSLLVLPIAIFLLTASSFLLQKKH